MSDIVNKLVSEAGAIEHGERLEHGADPELLRSAADEIEKLRAELASANERIKELSK